MSEALREEYGGAAGARVTMCAFCRHKSGGNCGAFGGPIPWEIVRGDVIHLEPIEGDGGVVFEPIAGQEREAANMLMRWR